MRRSIPAIALLLGASIVFAQTDSSAAASELRKQGIAACKSGNFALAAQDFRRAIDFDPSPENHRYLGATYAAQIVPNVTTQPNLRLADAALEEFDIVLSKTPDDRIALAQESAVYRNTNQLDKAKAVEQKLLPLDPTNPDVPYTIAVIDWRQANANATSALAQEHLRDDGVGNEKKSPTLCATLVTQSAALVQDAIANLANAIALKPDYADAMTYLSLIYRRRADLHCADPVSVTADVNLAQTWAENAKAAREHRPLPTPPPPASSQSPTQ